MNRPSTEDLARWDALARAATPGPWYARHTDDQSYMCCDFVSTEPGVRKGHDGGHIDDVDPGTVVALTLLQSPRLAEADAYEANVEFIAASRTAIPALLAEVAELQAERAAERFEPDGALPGWHADERFRRYRAFFPGSLMADVSPSMELNRNFGSAKWVLFENYEAVCIGRAKSARMAMHAAEEEARRRGLLPTEETP